MSLGLIGVKRGMTRIFTEDGASTPVTVLEVLAIVSLEPSQLTQMDIERFKLPMEKFIRTELIRR